MKIKKIFCLLLTAVTVFVCMPMSAYAEDGEAIAPEYVEGEILITSVKDVEDSSDVLFTASVSEDDTVYIDFDKFDINSIEEVENYTDDENMYIAETDGDVEAICKKLNKNGNIIAEPNYIYYTNEFTMPGEVSDNLNLYANHQKWYLNDKMHFTEAWQTHEVTGAGVTIAIIDNGFNVNSADFPTNLWLNQYGTPGWNTDKNNADISPIYRHTLHPSSDPNSDEYNPSHPYYNTYNFSSTVHGSNVAGIIGMRSNASGGIGAAYGAELMLIQAAHYVSETVNPQFTSEALASAINFARENGADIINLSLGSYGKSRVITEAINDAYDAGILIVAAAGNGDENGIGVKTSISQCYPAALSNVIGVMAIDKTNPSQLSVFSNYDTHGGQYYNIAAPGVSILGCNSEANGKVSVLSGTSQASPLVAAAAALYMEKFPDKTIQELTEDMLTSATEYVHAYNSSAYYYKSLNVLKFLDYCRPPEILYLTTDINPNGEYLEGFDEGFTDISDYIAVRPDTGSMTFTPTPYGNGTGATVNIYDINDRLYRTFTVIIFGDVNGDAYANAQDAVLIGCKLSGMNGFTLTTAQQYAADVSKDTVLGTNDMDIIINYSVKLDFIFQV